jgi:acyl carrier protein
MNTREKILDILDANGIYVDREKIENDIDLREYIIDSIQFINFIVEIEREMNIEFPDEFLLFDKIASINGFSSIIESIISGEYIGSDDDDDDDDDIFEVDINES